MFFSWLIHFDHKYILLSPPYNASWRPPDGHATKNEASLVEMAPIWRRRRPRKLSWMSVLVPTKCVFSPNCILYRVRLLRPKWFRSGRNGAPFYRNSAPWSITSHKGWKYRRPLNDAYCCLLTKTCEYRRPYNAICRLRDGSRNNKLFLSNDGTSLCIKYTSWVLSSLLRSSITNRHRMHINAVFLK